MEIALPKAPIETPTAMNGKRIIYHISENFLNEIMVPAGTEESAERAAI